MTFEDFEYTYNNIQITNKWKNLVDNYKVFFKQKNKSSWTFFLILILNSFFINKSQLAASKKSGGAPIVIQYKEDIETILNKDRPILNPKSCIDSSVSLSEKKGSDDVQENFGVDNKNEISYEKIGRKFTNKRENKELEVNLDNQDKKKSKNNKTNFENTLQNWLEQQEARQIETDKRREEQRLELFHMKQQNDMMLFGLLNNLTNCLNSLHGKSSNQSENNSFISQGN